MRRLNKIFTLVLICIFASCKESKTYTFNENDIKIIPQPAEMLLKTGAFEFTNSTKIVAMNPDQIQIAGFFIDRLKAASGMNLEIVDATPSANYIEFVAAESLADEAYELLVQEDKITIKSASNAGFLYAMESIRQLLPIAVESKSLVENTDWVIPNIEIKDQPRYKYRGLMLDVSRHFFEIDYLKKTVDRLAMLKMNVLHLHLIDDQGWRIEIKKYPKLTEVGAWRVDQEDKHWDGRYVTSPEEKGTYGGFYTQEELKDLVQYATARGVELIPEIEMPAHVSSAIASYPELSCHERPIGVPSGGVWPITDIYCAGKESTFEFLENVLTEVIEIFPSKYIHVGGDEATKTNWAKCANCIKRKQTEGLENVEELQSYFITRMERFINSKGKRLIGWDEILEGGLAPEATVMSWRGVKGGVEAAKQGHDVIMTPGSHCYFDHYQGPQNEEPLAWGGYTPLSKVYTFDPIVEELTAEETKHVLGGQANLWSEQIKTEDHSEYMIFPRLAALSETLWSPKELRNWDDFSSRILTMFKRYELLDINYAKSSYLVMEDVKIDMDTKEVALSLQNEFPDSDIRYAFNDSNLAENAKKYTEPLTINETTTIHASLFKEDKPIGTRFSKTIEFHKAVGKNITFKEKYDDRYQGEGEFGLVNTLRGTKNFTDGHWQAWLGNDMEAVIDLGEEITIQEVILGTLENQGPAIYFPTAVTVFVSNDGRKYEEVGVEKRPFAKNPSFDLKDFKITFDAQSVRYVKVIAINLGKTPKGGKAWLFVDEIIVK